MAGPTLTTDLTGNPWVEVFFPSLAAGTSRLRIYRLSEDRQWLVRGGVDIAAGVAALDFEAPFRTTASYRAEQFDALGNSLGFTDASSTYLDVDKVWIHNPLVPARGVELASDAILGAPAPVRRPTVGEVVYVEGASVGRWVGTRRRGVTGLNIGLAVESVEAADSIQAMLGTYSSQLPAVLCLRTPPPARMPRTFFAAVSDPDEDPVSLSWGGTRSNFFFTATEAEPPYPGLVTPLLSYDDLDAFGNYTAQDAGWITYTARDRAYELAGTAG